MAASVRWRGASGRRVRRGRSGARNLARADRNPVRRRRSLLSDSSPARSRIADAPARRNYPDGRPIRTRRLFPFARHQRLWLAPDERAYHPPARGPDLFPLAIEFGMGYWNPGRRESDHDRSFAVDVRPGSAESNYRIAVAQQHQLSDPPRIPSSIVAVGSGWYISQTRTNHASFSLLRCTPKRFPGSSPRLLGPLLALRWLQHVCRHCFESRRVRRGHSDQSFHLLRACCQWERTPSHKFVSRVGGDSFYDAPHLRHPTRY